MGMWGHGFGLAAADKKQLDLKLLGRTLRYMLPYRLAIAASIASVLTVTASDLARPYLVRILIDRDLPAASTTLMTQTLLLYGLTLLLGFGAMIGQRLVTGWIGLKVIWDLRDSVFRHLQTLSLRFYDNREMGDTISRMTNDIDLLNELISNGLVTLVNTLFALGGTVLAMLALDVRLSLLTLAIMPLLLLLTVLFRGWIGQAYRRTREKIAQVTAHVEEGVAGVRIIQSFAQEDRNIAQFNLVNEENRLANMEAAGLRSIYFPAIELVSSIGIATVLWFGGIAALRGDLTFGIIVAFLLYLFRFFQPIRNLTMLYDQVLAAMAASERIFELLDTKPDIIDPPNPVHLPRIEGRVEYRHVYFRYVENDPVLIDINLHAEPAEMIALVGATGSGKSTIISLLSRLYDVDEGQILIDGHDLREIAIKSLRTQLGIVLQEGFLFSTTIRENIRYGRLDATDEEIEEAAKAVGAHEFIMRMPDGYDTEVRERGEKLSMGERQLICLARALIADPRILILDEATSSIDPYTELIIQSALLKLFQGRTSIVIAHRLSTVRRADRIYVLDHGQIMEVGNHEELLAQGGLYAKLYEMQFKAQEEMLEEQATPDAAG
ncbi:MAG: ABC transporter ATP-binding protein [Chloroflexi bacterium]|nr:ABC transporter ATP-binding protein [Chloroflexota bacterium]